MAGVVNYRFAIQPAAKALEEVVVLEIHAPKSAVLHSRLGHRCVEVEHPDQARPLPRPIGNRKYWTAMSDKPGKNVMAVLPDSLDHNQRGFRRNLVKDLDAVPLAMNKAVLLDGIVGVTSADRRSTAANGGCHGLLHLCLCGPASLVC